MDEKQITMYEKWMKLMHELWSMLTMMMLVVVGDANVSDHDVKQCMNFNSLLDVLHDMKSLSI